MNEKIVEFWQRPLDGPSFVHPDDREKAPELFEEPLFATFEAYLLGKDFSPERTDTFQTSLFPVPYIGDLDKAKIFILMANPGFSPPDTLELAQGRVFEQFRNDLRKNLRQDFAANEAFPFFYLNPDYRWHNGFIYWEKRFREIAQQLQKDRDFKSYRDALSFMAKHIAVLQLVPYHSAEFPDGVNIPSTQKAIDWVNDILLPRAQNGKISLIVARKAQKWKKKKVEWNTKHDNILFYTPPQAHGAYFPLGDQNGKRQGGQVIYDTFCL